MEKSKYVIVVPSSLGNGLYAIKDETVPDSLVVGHTIISLEVAEEMVLALNNAYADGLEDAQDAGIEPANNF